MNILCKDKNKIKVRFYLFVFLENTCFVCICMGSGPLGVL